MAKRRKSEQAEAEAVPPILTAFDVAKLEAEKKEMSERIDRMCATIAKLEEEKRDLQESRTLSNRAWNDVRNEATKVRFLAVLAGDSRDDAIGKGLGLLLAPIAISMRDCADVGQGCIASPRNQNQGARS